MAIETAGRLPQDAAVTIEGKVGDEIRLAAPRGRIVRWQDFHGVLENAHADGSALRGRLAHKPGHHLVLAEIKVGELPQRQLFKLHVTDPAGDAALAAKYAARGAAGGRPGNASTWRGTATATCARFSNSNISRPGRKRVPCVWASTAIPPGRFAYWGDQPPAIDLGNVPKLADGAGTAS